MYDAMLNHFIFWKEREKLIHQKSFRFAAIQRKFIEKVLPCIFYYVIERNKNNFLSPNRNKHYKMVYNWYECVCVHGKTP